MFDGLPETDQTYVPLSSFGYFDCERSSGFGEEVCLVFKVWFRNRDKPVYVLAHQREGVRLLAFQWEIFKGDSFHISLACPYF